MSNVIDERVVEMRFDNAQFEQNANESIKTLGKLKKSLKLNNAGKDFKEIDKAANKVDLSGLESSVKKLENRFSTMGIVGMETIRKITDGLIGIGKGAWNKTIGFATESIFEGGKRRAQNIEGARFTLTGLLKDEEKVKNVMDEAMQSVDGTAYAFDEAAKAAAQFAASGLQAGKDLLPALRGITGVAAVGHADYESIAHVFNTIAGNGRLMGEQLNQMSIRGINAASVLADYFNRVNEGTAQATDETRAYIREITDGIKVTEAEIRELVTGKKIKASLFFEGMDEAFGEQAGKANETVEGALSNVKSALSRIGAEIYEPIIEDNGPLVELLNTIRLKINDIKAALVWDESTQFFDALTDKLHYTEDEATKFVNKMSEVGEVVSEKQLAKLTKKNEGGKSSTEIIADYINGVANKTVVADQNIKEAIELMKNQKLAAAVNRITKGEWLRNDLTGEDAFFNHNVVQQLQHLTNGLEVTAEDIAKFSEEGSFNFELLAGQAVLTAEDINNLASEGKLDMDILKSAIAETFGEKTIIKRFTDFVTLTIDKFNDWLKTVDGQNIGKGLSAFLNGIFNIFEGILSVLKPIGQAFADVFFAGNTATIQSMGEAFRDFFANFKISEETAGKLRDTFKGLFSIFDIIGRTLGAIIKGIFPGFAKGFNTIGGGILDFTSSVGRAITEFDEKLKNGTFLEDLSRKTSEVVDKIKTKFAEFIEFVKSIFGQAGDAVNTFIEPVKKGEGVLGELYTSVKDKFENAFGNASKSVQEFGKESTEVVDPIRNASNALEMQTVQLGETSKALEEPLTGFEKFKKTISDFVESQGGALEVAKKGGIIAVIALIIKKLRGSISKMSRVSSSVSKQGILGQVLFGSNVSNTLDNVSWVLGAFTKKIRAEALLKTALAIAVLAGSLIALTMVDMNKLGFAAGIILLLMTALQKFVNGLTVIFSQLATIKKGIGVAKGDKKGGLFGGLFDSILDTASTAITINAIGSLIMSIAGAVLVLTIGIRMLSGIDTDELWRGVAVISILSVIIGALALGLVALSEKCQVLTQAKGVGIFGNKAVTTMFKFNSTLGQVGAALLAIGVTVLILSKAIKNLSKLNPDELKRGLLSVTALVVELGVVSLAISKFGGKFKWTNGLAILLFAMSLHKLTKEVAFLGKLDTNELEQGLLGVLAIVGLMGTIIVAMGILTRNTKKSTTSYKRILAVGASLIMLAAGVKIIAKALKVLSKVSNAKLWNGFYVLSSTILAITVALSALAVVGSKTNGGLIKAAGAFVILAAAIAVLTPALVLLGVTAPIAIAGVAALTVLLLAMAGITAIFTEIAKSGEAFTKAIIGITALAAGMVLAAGAFYIFIAACEKLSEWGITGVASFLASFAALTYGVAKIIVEAAPTVVSAIMAVLEQVVIALLGIIPSIANALVSMFLESARLMSERADEFVGYFMDFVIKVLDKATEKAPQLIHSLFKFIKVVGDALNAALDLNGLSMSDLAQTIQQLQITLAGFAGLKFIAKASAVGIAAFSALMLELTACLAGIGAIREGIMVLFGEGADPVILIKSAGELLTALGEAVGGFIGGIAGGFAEGFSNSLPDIATNLSEFAKNLQPFLDQCAKIDGSYKNGIILFGALLAELTAIDFVEAYKGVYANWFGSEQDLSTLGDKFEEFGKDIQKFFAVFENKEGGFNSLDAYKIKTISQVALNLATAISTISTTLDSFDFHFGFANYDHTPLDNMETFSQLIGPYADAINSFCNKVADIKVPDNIDDVIKISERMVTVAQKIPEVGRNAGQLKQMEDGSYGIDWAGESSANWWAGENSIAVFGDLLAHYAEGLATFIGKMARIDVDVMEMAKVDKAVEISDKLVEIAKKIPNVGRNAGEIEYVLNEETLEYVEQFNADGKSAANWWVGENSIATFGNLLAEFARGLTDFIQIVSDIPIEDVTGDDAVAKMEALVGESGYLQKIIELSEGIPNFKEGSVVGFFGGNQDLDNFGLAIQAIAKGVKEFADAAGDITMAGGTVENAYGVLEKIVTQAAKITDSMPTNMEQFSGKLKGLGEGLRTFAEVTEGINILREMTYNPKREAYDFGESQVDKAVAVAKSIVGLFQEIDDAGLDKYLSGDQSLLENLGNGAELLGEGLSAYNNSIGTIEVNQTALSNAHTLTGNLKSIISSFAHTPGLEEWITDPSYTKNLGSALTNIGNGIADYAIAIMGTDLSDIPGSRDAALAIGGIIHDFPDVSSFDPIKFSDIGSRIKGFGAGMAAYSKALVEGGFSPSAVLASEQSALCIGRIIAAWPDTSSIDWTSFTALSDSLFSFGKGLYNYSLFAKEFDNEAIINSETAAKTVVGLLQSISAIEGISDLAGAGIELSEGILGALATTLPNFGRACYSYWSNVKQLKPEDVAGVPDIIEDIRDLAKDMEGVDASNLVNFTNVLADVNTSGVSNFIDAFADADKAITAIEAFMGAMDNAVVAKKENYNSLGGKLATYLSEGLSNTVTEMISQFETVGTTIAENIVLGIQNGISDNIKLVSTQILTEFTNINNTLGSTVASKFEYMGKCIIDGLSRGIDNNWGAFHSHWLSLMTSIVQEAYDAAGVASPAKKFIYMAKMIMKGFVVGIDRSEKSAIKRTKEAFNNLVMIAQKLGGAVRDTLMTNPGALDTYISSFESVTTYAKKTVKAFNEIYGKGGRKAIALMSAEIYKTSDAFKQSKERLKEYKKEIAELEPTAMLGEDNKDGKEAIDRIAELRNSINEEMEQMIEDQKNSFIEWRNTIKEGIKDSLSMFEEYEFGDIISANQIVENSQSNIDAYTKWSNSIGKLITMGFNKKFIKEIAEQGIGSANIVAALLGATPEQIAEINANFKEQKQIAKHGVDDIVSYISFMYKHVDDLTQEQYDKRTEKWQSILADPDSTKKQRKKAKKRLEEISKNWAKSIYNPEGENYVDIEVNGSVILTLDEIKTNIEEDKEKLADTLRGVIGPTLAEVSKFADIMDVDDALMARFVDSIQGSSFKGVIGDIELATQAMTKFGYSLIVDTDEYKEVISEIEALQKYLQQENLTSEYTEQAKKDITELYKKADKLARDAVKDVYNNIKSAIRSSINLFSAFTTEAETKIDFTSKYVKETLKEDSKEIVDIFGATAKDSLDAFSKIEKASSISKKSLLKIMKSQSEQTAKYRDMLSDLDSKRSQGLISDDMYASIKAMGMGGMGYMKALLKMTDAELREANEAFADTGRINAENYLTAMKDAIADDNKRNNNLDTLLSRGLSKDIYDDLMAQGDGAAETINNLINLTEEELREVNDLYELAQNAGKTGSEVVLDTLRANVQAVEEWEADLNSLSGVISEALFDKLKELGPDGAKYVKAFKEMTAAELAEAEALFNRQSEKDADTIVANAKAQLEQVRIWAEKLQKLSARLTAQGLGTAMVQELATKGPEEGEAIIDALLGMSDDQIASYAESYNGIEALVESVSASIVTAISDGFEKVAEASVESGKTTGQETNEAVAEGMTEAEPDVESAAADAGDVTNETLSEKLDPEKISEIGKGVGKGLIKGMDSKLAKVKDKAIEVAKSIKQPIKNRLEKDIFIEIGENIDKGLKRGIVNSSYKPINAAGDLARQVVAEIRSNLRVASPSKVTSEIGMFTAEGLAMGIAAFAYMAINAADDMANDVVNEFGVVSDVLSDQSYAPNIVPNIDMDEAINNASALNSMLSLDKLNANMTIETHNKDIVNAIGDMRSDFASEIDRLSESINKIQVVMDSGQLVGSITDKMDHAIGQRMTYQRRGMM